MNDAGEEKTESVRRLLELDARHVWHPFTQHMTEAPPIPVARARGVVLETMDGREILDLVSSWWTSIHGHGHPALVRALADQAARLDHVMFAGFTHPPAVELAARIARLLPGDLDRVFFSDDGSTAVEVALKAAWQYWRNRGAEERRLFIAFEGGYHGDTLGAMTLGQGCGFFTMFRDLMFEVRLVPWPQTWLDDDGEEHRRVRALARLKEVLRAERGRIAAVIMEPLMQGAAGMRLCTPPFVRAVVELCREEGILVIFDEVAVGFGRLGTMFAMEQAEVVPDMVCLSKGLVAGMLPMSVTVVREPVFRAFLGEDFERALAHGHTFTANPLACAVALRSLELFEEERSLEAVRRMERLHLRAAQALGAHPLARRVRVKGSMLAFDLDIPGGYRDETSTMLERIYLDMGLNIRPLDRTVYLMPPYCMTEAQLRTAHDGLLAGLDELRRRLRG